MVVDDQEVPQMSADSISTIISDSGIIRYRISAVKWEVYGKTKKPYWAFPDGLHFERFDKNYKVDAKLDCKSAIYYVDDKLWKLDDSVNAVNLAGERFETQQLFWNQKTEKVYSDSLITIIKQYKIIIGVGFESDQTFSKYQIRHIKGEFPVDNQTEDVNP